jgi:hypothetical protein
VLTLSLVPVAPAGAVFGLSKCEKAKKAILTQENLVNQKLRSLKNVGNLVPIKSPLITSVYANGDSLETALLKIRKTGLANSKCFNSYQNSRLQVNEYWNKNYYVEIYPLVDYVAVTVRDKYLNLYGLTFK